MLNFLAGMMNNVQDGEAVKSFGYRHMAPLMMGWWLSDGASGGFGYYLGLVFAIASQVLILAILVAFLRWLWQKGDAKK